MRKVMMIMVQVLIFVGAWATMTPDQLVDNTYVFGLFGSHDVIAGNTVWVLLGAAILSALNILIWWPKSPTRQSVEVAADKSAEAKAEETKDPIVPKMD